MKKLALSLIIVLTAPLVGMNQKNSLFESFITQPINKLRSFIMRRELQNLAQECKANEERFRNKWQKKAQNPAYVAKAIDNNNNKRIQRLLFFGANPNLIVRDFSLLTRAVSNNNIEMAKTLLDYGADSNQAGKAPLIAALQKANEIWHNTSETNYLAMTELLLTRGANPNFKQDETYLGYPNYYDFPLHHAHCPNSIPLLLKWGAQVNFQDHHGKTALHDKACSKYSLLKVLVQHGADLLVADDKGNTPSHIAAQTNLKWHNNDIDKVNIINRSKAFFFFALQKGQLIQALTTKNNDGETPIDHAKKHTDKHFPGFSQFLEDCKNQKKEALQELFNVGTQEEFKLLKEKNKGNIALSLRNREITGKSFNNF